MRELLISQRQWEIMRAHVHACLPQEACGLLAGKGNHVHEVYPITNELRSMTRFRMAPAEQIRAFAEIEAGGMELLGIFHSHPALVQTGTEAQAGPSTTDVAEAAYPVVHVVWSRAAGQWQAGAYWIEAGVVSHVTLTVEASE